ncbi:MAG: SPASM domain-containing protein [Candidatus Gastranaerophilales bacterium]|nr:SPASM domain-containing protein [Candidatus Gastranaerophilales bacterium]
MQEIIKQEIKDKGIICTRPFTHLEVYVGGNAYCCCADYNDDYYLGNIFEQSFEEIWNGEKINAMRKEVLEGTYKPCHLELCYNIEAPCFADKKTFSTEIQYPFKVGIHADLKCNVKCIFCRDEYVNEPYLTYKHSKLIDSTYIPMLKNAKLLILNGDGELFVSKFYKDLIPKVASTYPDIKFELLTNGLLCDEKHIEQFGLTDRMGLVMVSIHAATEETYNKIVIGSDFKKVIKNIEYLAKLKKEERLGELILSYVVCSLNYKELPEFIEYTYSIGAVPQIWPVVAKGNDSKFCSQDFQKYDVTNKSHPEHEKYVEILNHPVFKKYSIITNDLIVEENKENISHYFET